MAVKKQADKAIRDRLRRKRQAAKKTFTMRHLWRMALWGATAASALLLAVLTTRSEVGSQRIAALFSSSHGRSAGRRPAIRRAGRNPPARRGGARSDGAERPTQIAARSRRAQHRRHHRFGHPTDRGRQSGDGQSRGPPMPSPNRSRPRSSPRSSARRFRRPEWLCRAASIASADHRPRRRRQAKHRRRQRRATEYGVDIGSALSIEVLRARWLGIRSAHGNSSRV